MSEYTPHAWVIVRITHQGEVIDKVLGGWYGGFADPNSWRINSGIVSISELEDHYEILGHTGSVYHCYKSLERMSLLMTGILSQMQNEGAEGGFTVEAIPISELEK